MGPGPGREEVRSSVGGEGGVVLAEAEGMVGHVEDPAVGADERGPGQLREDVGRTQDGEGH